MQEAPQRLELLGRPIVFLMSFGPSDLAAGSSGPYDIYHIVYSRRIYFPMSGDPPGRAAAR